MRTCRAEGIKEERNDGGTMRNRRDGKGRKENCVEQKVKRKGEKGKGMSMGGLETKRRHIRGSITYT